MNAATNESIIQVIPIFPVAPLTVSSIRFARFNIDEAVEKSAFMGSSPEFVPDNGTSKSHFMGHASVAL